jgi:hypothetical protein
MRDAHNERLPTKKELGSSAHKLRQLSAAKARQQLLDQEEDLYDAGEEVSTKPVVLFFL